MRMRALGRLIRWTRRSWVSYRVSLGLGCVLRRFVVLAGEVVVPVGEVDRDRDRDRRLRELCPSLSIPGC